MCDLSTAVPMLTGNSLCISARTGAGLIEFAQAVRAQLVSAADIASDRPWQFC